MSEQAYGELTLQVEELSLGKLTTNAQIILATVKKKLEGYSAENYNEDNIGEAKKDKADLNNAAKKLNDERLALERKWLEPFEEFKSIVTETVTEIKKASSQIDAVVKEVEQREKDEKKARIVAIFDKAGCQLFTLDQIFNPSWLNKGSKEKDIKAEIEAKIEKVKADLLVLDRINEPEARVYYLNTLNLESALSEADRIKQNRERLASLESAKATPATEPEPDPIPVIEPEPVRIYIGAHAPLPAASPEIHERRILVRGTKEQLIALGEYLKAHGMEFEKIL
jgi:hypothetical protein